MHSVSTVGTSFHCACCDFTTKPTKPNKQHNVNNNSTTIINQHNGQSYAHKGKLTRVEKCKHTFLEKLCTNMFDQ